MEEKKMITWDEITVGQYDAFIKLDPNDEDYELNVLSIFTNKTKEEINEMPYNKYVELGESINVSGEIPSVKTDTITIDGIELTVKENFDDIKVGEIMYVQRMMKDKKIEEVLLPLLPIVLTGDGWKYNGDDKEDLQRRINFLSKAKLVNLVGCLSVFNVAG